MLHFFSYPRSAVNVKSHKRQKISLNVTSFLPLPFLPWLEVKEKRCKHTTAVRFLPLFNQPMQTSHSSTWCARWERAARDTRFGRGQAHSEETPGRWFGRTIYHRLTWSGRTHHQQSNSYKRRFGGERKHVFHWGKAFSVIISASPCFSSWDIISGSDRTDAKAAMLTS